MHDMPEAHSLWVASLAVAVHTIAMLVVTGAVAIIVYEWVGLGFLRRGWINVDLAWNLALIGTGLCCWYLGPKDEAPLTTSPLHRRKARRPHAISCAAILPVDPAYNARKAYFARREASPMRTRRGSLALSAWRCSFAVWFTSRGASAMPQSAWRSSSATTLTRTCRR